MSMLKFVFCVAALCIAQAIAGTKALDKDAVIGRIDQAIKNIDESATKVYRRFAEIGPLDPEKLFDRYIPEPREAAWNLTSNVKNLVDAYIRSSSLKTNEEKEACRAVHDSWREKFIDAVQGSMEGSPYNGYYYSNLAFGKLLHVASENKIVLKNLKDRVQAGSTTEWNEIILNVEKISTNFSSDAAKIQKYYESIVDGTGIMALVKSRTNWDENFNSGIEILQKVFKCAKPRVGMYLSDSRALPHIFNYDYDRMVREGLGNHAEIDLV